MTQQPAPGVHSDAFAKAQAAMLGTRRVRRSDKRLKERIKLLQLGLSFSTGLLLVALVAGGLTVREAARERDRLRSELGRAESDLVIVRTELEQLHEQNADLVSGRIPNLLPLEFDRLVAFTGSSVRNITFTEVRNGGRQGYEYHAVLQNRGTENVTPAARVVLFDEMGMQMGMGPIIVGELYPNEVESYTGVVDVIAKTTPRYFAVVTDSGMLAVEQRQAGRSSEADPGDRRGEQAEQ